MAPPKQDHSPPALRLIENIYRAAVEPSAWQDFVEDLSAAYDGAAVAFALQLPGFPLGISAYAVGFDPEYHAKLPGHLVRGLPWREAATTAFVGRFGLGSEAFPDAEVAETDFYREWMQPQGLAACCPLGHTIEAQDGRPIAAIAIFRQGGGRPFEKVDSELGDLLVPHLGRAYRLHRSLREHAALAEALDRLPTGVVLLDAQNRLVLANLAARTIVALDDGFAIDADGPRASRPADNAVLKQMLRQPGPASAPGRIREGNVMAVSRPSGKRAFPLMIAPLLGAPPESTLGDARSVIYISDLEGSLEHGAVLRTLYSLTEAETQLVGLLCEGCSLEESAERRGVTINTARSQLKQVFAKTNTSRQGELVRLVLAGIAPIRDP